ncbi:MAG: Crp/Fnr family transcriptional regulator [Chloroflexota bacterium]
MSERDPTPREALARVPLFAGLAPAELDALTTAVVSRRYPRGGVIMLQGEEGNGLCIIGSGLVKIVLTGADGREQLINVYGPAEFFGEFALLDGEPRSADAIAQEDCLIYWLHRDRFQSFLANHPMAAISLLAILSRRLRHTTRLLESKAFQDVPTRVAGTILQLAASRGRPTGSGIIIDAQLTQSELASMVGANRETVNRCVRDFQRRGLLTWERSQITINDQRRLRNIADGA